MSKRRKQVYRSSVLADLARQLLYSPPEKRAEVVKHAEHFHDELDPAKNYPIDFVVYRLTHRRVPPSDHVMLVGEAIGPDLRLLIDVLSRSIELVSDPDDPGMTTAQLADSLGVSSKTVSRWRDAGLRWRWGVREAGEKPRVLITRSALTAFESHQGVRIAAASRFTRLVDHEKARLIHRAKRLAAVTDALPQQVLEHLSKRSGRSVETLRLLIQEHDQNNPETPVFAERTGPLTDRQKRLIDRAYQRGVTVSQMCQRFGKTRSTIYRVIHQGRAQRAIALPITVVYFPTFERDDADEVLLQSLAKQGKSRTLSPEVIAVVPEELKAIYDRPIKPDPAVRSLIVRYNFIKYRASMLQQAIRESTPRATDLDQFDALIARATKARGEVLAAVLPIVLSVVRRQLSGKQRTDDAILVGMLGIANDVLIEEVDRFDATLAHTFESVLTNRLLRVFAKPIAHSDTPDASRLFEQLSFAGFEISGSSGH